ncbi:cytochrome b561 and DOMON domain-containing protein At4g17280-like [Henckelia pumila]|uniref:cytochrome b561 and DOMON domain-containing protein At4g17280-like n=1 Tax=Henckelia pumila TaxID=405737 RepID=UPI003C6E271B
MLKLVLIFIVLLSMHVLSYAQSCATYNFASNQVFSSCNDLPYLNSFLHWDYDQSANTVKIAYRHMGVTSSNWVAWAINPISRGMVGAQALVAFQKSDGTMRTYTAPINSYQIQLQEGDLSFPVSDLSATYSGNEIVIFATLKLDNLSSTVNQVWQEGLLSNDSPVSHSTSGPNVQSMGTLDLISGDAGTRTGVITSKTRRRNIHGVLNAISWGIMIPFGAMLARYLKVFPTADPAWFYLHSMCQTSGYIIGVVGWATGLQLGRQSQGIQFTSHRIIGIILFSIATLQVLALLLRPKKNHKYRSYWNIYHHLLGYSITVLGIINIFKGFNILRPDEKWKTTYIGILVGLAFVAATMEVYTWYVVLKRKKSSNPRKMHNEINGTNGYHGYGTRAQDRV